MQKLAKDASITVETKVWQALETKVLYNKPPLMAGKSLIMADVFDDVFDETESKAAKVVHRFLLPYGYEPRECLLEQRRIELIRLVRRHGRTPDEIASFMNGVGQHRRAGTGLWDAKHVRYLLRKYPVRMDLKNQKLTAGMYELIEQLGLDDALGIQT